MKAANLCCPVEECNPMNDTRERPGDICIAGLDSLGHGPGMLSLIFLGAQKHPSTNKKHQNLLHFASWYRTSPIVLMHLNHIICPAILPSQTKSPLNQMFFFILVCSRMKIITG